MARGSRAEIVKEWRKNNPEKARAAYARDNAKRCPEKTYRYNKNRFLKSTYGLTLDDFEKMIEDQNHLCKVCHTDLRREKKKNVHVDHCHETGRVRGILCHGCNTGLGAFRDNPALLEAAKRYLENANG